MSSLVPTTVSSGDPFEEVADVGANVVEFGSNPFGKD
jgi:hypothetical protein